MSCPTANIGGGPPTNNIGGSAILWVVFHIPVFTIKVQTYNQGNQSFIARGVEPLRSTSIPSIKLNK